MAEFKLGRIKFVWKNQWVSNSVYYRDDVVSYGGKIYICVVGHTSSNDFFADLDVVPSKWNVMSEGQTWKGDWQRNTYYVYNDIVKFGPNLFICTTVHTSTTDLNETINDELSNWDTFGTGFEYKGEWNVVTQYYINDLVKYGAQNFVCTVAHLSANTFSNGLESNISNWELYSTGVEFKGEWTVNTKYKITDLVKYGSTIYYCNSYHVSSAEFGADTEKWQSFVEGITFESYWTSTTDYQQGDIVIWGGYQYIAKRQNLNTVPTSSDDDWTLFSKGLALRGEYGTDSSNFYKTGEVVTVGALSYVAKQDNTDFEPGETNDWDLYWDKLVEGFNWRGEWIDDAYYLQGDVVRYNNTAYVCLESHVSEGDDYSTETKIPPGGGAQNSRPDLDNDGRYWNVIVIGSELDPLQERGDLVYFNNQGPTRLPIGASGQILKVSTIIYLNGHFLDKIQMYTMYLQQD